MGDYCTAAEVRTLMRNTGLDVTDDALLTSLATRASRMLDRYFAREDGEFNVTASDTIRYFDGNSDVRVLIGDYASVTSVAVDEGASGTYTAWTLNTDYWLWPDNTMPTKAIDVNVITANKPYFPAHRRAVKVTGKPGYATTTPDAIKQAAVAQTVRLLKRATQSFADTGAVIDLSQLRYVQQIDPEVAALVQSAEYFRVAFG